MKQSKDTMLFIFAIVALMLISFVALFQGKSPYSEIKESKLLSITVRVHMDESKYQKLAGHSMKLAQQNALSHTQGEIVKVELDDEDGSRIYTIEIATPEKDSIHLITVAGICDLLRVRHNDGGT